MSNCGPSEYQFQISERFYVFERSEKGGRKVYQGASFYYQS